MSVHFTDKDHGWEEIRKELDGSITDLKSKHVQEKQALTDRQKKDRDAVLGRVRK